MYIPEFWCGVGLTLVVEYLLVMAIGLFHGRKDKGGHDDVEKE